MRLRYKLNPTDFNPHDADYNEDFAEDNIKDFNEDVIAKLAHLAGLISERVSKNLAFQFKISGECYALISCDLQECIKNEINVAVNSLDLTKTELSILNNPEFNTRDGFKFLTMHLTHAIAGEFQVKSLKTGINCTNLTRMYFDFLLGKSGNLSKNLFMKISSAIKFMQPFGYEQPNQQDEYPDVISVTSDTLKRSEERNSYKLRANYLLLLFRCELAKLANYKQVIQLWKDMINVPVKPKFFFCKIEEDELYKNTLLNRMTYFSQTEKENLKNILPALYETLPFIQTENNAVENNSVKDNSEKDNSVKNNVEKDNAEILTLNSACRVF